MLLNLHGTGYFLASELFSPTVLVNLPSKKLSFGCSDLFPELKIDTELSLPTPVVVQEEPIQVCTPSVSPVAFASVHSQRFAGSLARPALYSQ